MSKRIVSLLLAAIILLAITPGAMADFRKGGLSGGYYSSPDGISFRVPEGFTLSRQENRKAGFFRIVFSGPYDARYFGPAIVVDVIPGRETADTYTGRKLASDLVKYPIANGDKYTDVYVMSDRLFEEGGMQVRENLVVFKLNRFSEARVAFSYTYTFGTGENMVRASYICFAAQRTLTNDIPNFQELFNTLVIP